MKNLLSLFATLSVLSAWASSTVTVTGVRQDAATGVVTVTYDLAGDPAIVTFGATTNSVALPDAACRRVGGAVNRLVQPGTGHAVTWCPYENDRNIVLGSANGFAAQLKAWPTNEPPDYLVYNLLYANPAATTLHKPDSGAFSYYTSTNAFPYPVTDRRYKTDYLVMRKIPAKNVVWRMGSPTTESNRSAGAEQPHYVKLTNDFYMAIYEITTRQAKLIGDTVGQNDGYKVTVEFPNSEPETHPVDGWGLNSLRGTAWPTNLYASVGGYLANWQQKLGIPVDIPTDAQWEFACRGGSPVYEKFPGEASGLTVDDVAWHNGNSLGDTVHYTGIYRMHEVGLKAPNGYGLYDMLGNMSEYVLDWYASITSQLPAGKDFSTYVFEEPIGPDAPSPFSATDLRPKNTLRGGGFASASSYCRSACRISFCAAYGDGPATSYCPNYPNDKNSPKYDANAVQFQKASYGIRLTVTPASAAVR